MIYEYKTEWTYLPELQDYLNEMGQEGWDLVSFWFQAHVPDGSGNWGSPSMFVVMKREAAQDQPVEIFKANIYLTKRAVSGTI